MVPVRSRLPVAELVTAVAALLTMLLGAVVFVGWSADIDPMRRGFMGSIHMLPNTAVAAMLAGASLWLARRPRAPAWKQRTSRLLALVLLLLGAVTFAERLFDWDAGIDMLLFPELVRLHRYQPYGRMAASSALGFTLAALALLSITAARRPLRRLASLPATIGVAIASVAMVGHLYDAEILYLGDVNAGMSLVAAVTVFVINVGILAARPVGGMAMLLSSSDAGMVARRLVASLVVVPLLLGKLFIVANSQAVISRETGTAVLVVTVIGILMAVALRSALVISATERAREETIQREAAARREAERAMHAKSDFLAVMSHELRTPLNAIIGYSSLLNEGIPDPGTAAQRRQFDRITSSARHLLALIDEVLTLSRMELGDERLEPANVTVRQVMEEAAVMVEPQAAAKGLTFSMELPDPQLTIQTDAVKLRQALVNILGNAVKFTESGEIHFRTVDSQPGELLVFEVEDTGQGIPPEHLEHVFDSFWQVDQARSRRAGGVGLGLHVTRQLVRLLGGDVSVCSTVGKGSCFTVRLPRYWWGATTAEFSRATPVSSPAVRPDDAEVPAA